MRDFVNLTQTVKDKQINRLPNDKFRSYKILEDMDTSFEHADPIKIFDAMKRFVVQYGPILTEEWSKRWYDAVSLGQTLIEEKNQQDFLSLLRNQLWDLFQEIAPAGCVFSQEKYVWSAVCFGFWSMKGDV
jgi:hypothetical protein